tara:strand:+ start:202 stop:471 length:270 start_codon:yes stop_codon:yes gene_type:complete
MADLRSRHLIVLKGLLFLMILGLSSVLLLVMLPGWRTALLIALVAWSAARFYYFVFYVLEHYVDPTLKYAGLMALVAELRRRVADRRSR